MWFHPTRLFPLFNLILHTTPVILSLQQPSGVFAGDAFGETDTRFLYCAVSALSLIGQLDEMNKGKAVEYIERCKNYDGGFGNSVGAESHAGQGALPCYELRSLISYLFSILFYGPWHHSVFVCVAALAILDRLDTVDVDTLTWWLSERQMPSGGLNGRPEKLEDVSHIFLPLVISACRWHAPLWRWISTTVGRWCLSYVSLGLL